MSAWQWSAVAFGAWCVLSVPAGLAAGWFLARRKPPVPGPVHPDATPRPSPVPRAPAPGLLGNRVMAVEFYDTGATKTFDYRRGIAYVDLPPVDDDGIQDWLTGEAAP